MTSYSEDKNVISFSSLFGTLWRRKWVIIVVTFLAGAGAAYYAYTQPDVYRAEVMTVLPQEDSAGGLGAVGGQLGGLASLAGISMGDAGTMRLEQVEKLIRSRSFIQSFIEKHDIKKEIYAAEGWNPDTNELIYNNELYDPETDTWTRPGGEPSSWMLFGRFLELINVEIFFKKNMLILQMDHYSPYLAKRWAELLVDELNTFYREKNQREAQESMSFLRESLKETELVQVRDVFYDLLEEQTKKAMLTEVRQEYAFETLAPAVLPEDKNHPKRPIITALGVIGGGILGVILAFIIEGFAWLRRHRQD